MKRGKYKKRTNEEDEVIIRMRAEGKTTKEIANAIGRNHSSTQHIINRLINECKVAKRCKPSKVVASDLVDTISKNPGNIQEAFRQYSKKTGISINTIHNVYYRNRKNSKRIKDSTSILTVVSKYGHTTNNSKNTQITKRSNLWLKIKDWLYSALLS